MPGLGHWYVEIEKQGFWRGAVHTWVNRYVMSGSDPSATVAATVIGGLKTIENQVQAPIGVHSGVGFVEGRAYGSAGGPPFEVVNYNSSLTPATATGFTGPSGGYATLYAGPTLETCLDVRMPLTGLSSTGKPVWCRKYFRAVSSGVDEAGIVTPISGADLALINSICLPWQTGVAGTSYVVIGTSGKLPSGPPTAQSFIGNHQVPRGKKKKKITLTQAQVQAALNP